MVGGAGHRAAVARSYAVGVDADRDRLVDEQIDAYVALMEVAGQLRFRLEQHLRAESELSYVQFEILGRLMRAPENRLRMTDVADGVVISRSGLTYQVAALAEAGYVERTSSHEDERSTIVELTSTGQAEFLRVLPGHVEIVRAVLIDAIPTDEFRGLGSSLDRIRNHMRALPPRSARRRSAPPRAGD